MLGTRETIIVSFIKSKSGVSSKEILDHSGLSISYATLKRILTRLLQNNYLITTGVGRGTKYVISPTYELLESISMEEYFTNEIDERKIKQNFNFDIFNSLADNSIFTQSELDRLNRLQNIFESNVANLTKNQYSKDLERLAIDLSWKSSQIEGNTYSLLETELLLKEQETAKGKTQEETIMLLNHKQAIDFIISNPKYLSPITVSKIEDIHSILIKDLGINKNIRKRRIGISGTNYRPLDNEYQILESMKSACNLINEKKVAFEKSLLALLLLSYIQPFSDGNKRTARIVSNALLMDEKCCPISYRTVNSIDYKKAVLIFYEQNNVFSFKKLFIEQYEFAVNTYF